MSFLTRTFVIMHVVLSLLLTAGLVVFVNKVQNYESADKAAKAQIATLNAQVGSAQADAAAARADQAAAAAQSQQQVAAIQTLLTKAQQDVADRDKQLADAATKSALDSAHLTQLTDGLKASEDQKKVQQDIITALRTDNDTFVKKNADLNMAVSDLTNKLDSTERERTNLSEQLSQAQGDLSNAKTQLGKAGVTESSPVVNPNAGVPPINAVVRNVTLLPGRIPVAEISVGSDDAVQVGTIFHVFDRQAGKFLADLTVTAVQPNAATGVLKGPSVDQVKPGVEARTQL